MFDEKRCAEACAHIARRIVRPAILDYLRPGRLAVETKPDFSPVTAADREIEQATRRFLAAEFPGYGLLGEEFGPERLDSEYVWSIDPVDGTEAFAAGLPLFGTLLALIRQSGDGCRQPLLGAVYLPLQDHLIVGNRATTTLDGVSVRMPAPPDLERQCLILGNVSVLARNLAEDKAAQLFALAGRFRSTQTWGDCWGYHGMLLGAVHARFEGGLGVDDVAPLEPIILGAGGMVTDWEGRSITEAFSRLPSLDAAGDALGVIVSASPSLHRQMMDILAMDPARRQPEGRRV